MTLMHSNFSMRSFLSSMGVGSICVELFCLAAQNSRSLAREREGAYLLLFNGA